MKNTILVFLAIIVISCSKSTLKTTVENSENGTAYLLNTITQRIDTVTYNNNSFSLTTEIKEPTVYHLFFEEINNWDRPIYLILSQEPTEIKFDSLVISGRTQSWLDLYPNRPTFIKDPNKNESFYQFQKLWASFSDSIISLSTEDLNIHFDQRNTLHENFIVNCGRLIKKDSNMLVSAFIIKYLINNNLINLSKIQEYYSYLSSEIKYSSIGLTISIESGLPPNSKAPYFEVTDMNGTRYTLTSLENNKILLHFWSTSCAPCIEEIPELLELFATDENLVIINVSLDIDNERWTSGVAKLGINKMINTCDLKGTKSEIAQKYHISSIPANYLINEQGEIIAKKQHIGDIVNELDKYVP